MGFSVINHSSFRGYINDWGCIARDEHGGAVYETVYVNPNQLKVEWFENNGNRITPSYSGIVKKWMFQASGPGIDTSRVREIEYPKMSYSSSSSGPREYKVKVIMQVYENRGTAD
jgi:hypothetical protein